jgi:hypothetical protein
VRTLLWCLVAALPAVCTASESAVTILLNYEQPHSARSFDSLQSQLKRMLGDLGVRLDIRERNQAAVREQFSELFVFQMKGHCSMEPWPVGALSDERGALAMAYSSQGEVLPFGEVECDRVRQSLQRVLGRENPNAYQSAFGTALGLVLAHEIYHMLAHSPKHTRYGVTKESLSGRELLESDLVFPDAARLAIRRNLPQQR